MGKKLSQASTKICKTSSDKKQFNSLIKVLRPKVYITDSSNFKRLVQELTGNGNGNGDGDGNENPFSFHQPSISNVVVPIMEIPGGIVEIEDDQGYQERSLDSSVDSSEASIPTCVAAGEDSPQEAYEISDTFNVLESCLGSHNNKMDDHFSPYGDIESWLLEIDSCSYNFDIVGNNINIPGGIQQEVSVHGYEFSSLM